MRIYAFIDLDDTLFQTRRKCMESETLIPAASSRDGAPLSFMTRRQQALFNWLAEGAQLIPTTARNYDAFRRVALPWSGPAILDFGGVILGEDGQPDTEWETLMRGKTAAISGELEKMQRELATVAEQMQLQVRSRIISDFGMSLYIVAKNVEPCSRDLEQLRGFALSHFENEEFYIHFNDNNLAIVPRFLNKRHAVKHLIESRFRADGEEFMTLGIGDSLSDLDFMCLTDFSIVPRASQIMSAMKGHCNV